MIYLHLGVATLLITGALAWFVNREQQTASQAGAQAGQTSASGQPDRNSPSTEREVSDGRSNGGSWGPEPRPPRFDDGIPTTTPRRGPAVAGPSPARIAPSAADWRGLTGMEEPSLPGTATLVEVDHGQPGPEELAQMLRQSAERSGGGERAPDH